MDSSRLSTFRVLVRSIIEEVEDINSNLNIHDLQSLINSVKRIRSLKTQYGRTFNAEAFASSVYNIARPVRQAHEKTIRELSKLFKTLKSYKQTIINKSNGNSNIASSYMSTTDLKQLKYQPLKRSPKRKAAT